MSTTYPKRDQAQLHVKLKVLNMDSNKEVQVEKRKAHKNYKGFVAGVFSGVSKLTGKSLARLGSISGD
jgi:hypothetical protein